mmetsp:Transcript_58/g.137  ORF Transcript_58/g.137 Transcript_58/m.137 type:complete len:106 (+) Transcript_58:1081-1398(+)
MQGSPKGEGVISEGKTRMIVDGKGISSIKMLPQESVKELTVTIGGTETVVTISASATARATVTETVTATVTVIVADGMIAIRTVGETEVIVTEIVIDAEGNGLRE